MRDLTLSQEYLLCAVNEKGRLPHLGVERTVCLVAAALLELQLEGCVAVDKKYVTVTGPLPEGQAHLRPLYAFVNRPKPIRKEKLLEELYHGSEERGKDQNPARARAEKSRPSEPISGTQKEEHRDISKNQRDGGRPSIRRQLREIEAARRGQEKTANVRMKDRGTKHVQYKQTKQRKSQKVR